MGVKFVTVPSTIFSSKELSQYESKILDNKNVTEHDASRFFSRYPKFLTIDGYAEFAKEIVLYQDGKRHFRVDFFRRKFGGAFWDVVELKTPKTRILSKTGKHNRFAHKIDLAIHQSLNYRDILENDKTRNILEKKAGIQVCRPNILIIGGRSSQQTDPFEVKNLISRFQNINLYTYDDIYKFATECYNSKFIVIPSVHWILDGNNYEQFKRLLDVPEHLIEVTINYLSFSIEFIRECLGIEIHSDIKRQKSSISYVLKFPKEYKDDISKLIEAYFSYSKEEQPDNIFQNENTLHEYKKSFELLKKRIKEFSKPILIENKFNPKLLEYHNITSTK